MDQATASAPLPSEVVEAPAHLMSIVVPVYRGARTLDALAEELAPLTTPQTSPKGHRFRVAEVFLVHDGAVDDSDVVMEKLAARYPFISLIWLSRNYGQHPATLAGMASTTCEWVVTLDEDGQYDPAYLGPLLDRALETGAQLVYAIGTNAASHGFLRNAASGTVKLLATSVFGLASLGRFSSYRLVNGEVARSLAAYCGNHVYLDVALSWVVGRSERCPVKLRDEGERVSGYSWRSLFSHFGRLVLTSGTRPLRMISVLGVFAICVGIAIFFYALWQKVTMQVPVQGWTSTVLVICFFSGCILFSLGVVAEYLGVALSMAMGKPLYLVVGRPLRRPQKP